MSNIFQKNREFRLHPPISGCKKNSKTNTFLRKPQKEPNMERENKNKKQKTHWYEQKCQFHTCSGTINSSMYDSGLTITTSPLTSSASYSG